ncbi:hypothetical protein CWB73_17125 [Pseudoalteromonas phenolica]|uniref:Uncharacterized protein n=1 Tax=Pseudoalteromonas phenolica TaxID=161398 RepID=A0A5S3YQW8_9GAMM|nr:hypothetical protein CWB73_17125 [Pseudoalteromonas phenolica]
MRIRHKLCGQCQQAKSVMYRCRFDGNVAWQFVCGACLLQIKKLHTETYQYGGTWKARKK